jgi:hypothetical protein
MSSVGSFDGIDIPGIFYHTWYRIPVFNHSVRKKCLLISSLAACCPKDIKKELSPAKEENGARFTTIN